MVIKIPQSFNFPDSLTKILENTNLSVSSWEISVPRKDDIAWSIVLSYLISTNYRDPKDFAQRLKTLTGAAENLTSVKKAIRSFNPFRNRFTCFYNKSLKQVVSQFKILLNWNNLLTVSEKLSSAFAQLGLPILLIWKDSNEIKHRIYSKNHKKCRNLVALFASEIANEDSETTGTVYNFLLNDQFGLKLKNASLLYFLKEVKISEKARRKILSTAKKDNPFLISILKSNCGDVIKKLYKSPYVVSKLAEAGFEVDPRTKDSDGLSALYHALALGDIPTLNILYYFAVNNCYQSEGTYRNPDSQIVTNLLQMEEILSADFSKSENFNLQKYDNMKKIFRYFLRLNKFLIEVNRKFISIKNKLNYYDSTDETVFEACKRRDIIVCILHTYEEFFEHAQQDNITVSPLDDYITFKNYYNLIDIATAVMFFDNIISLKERLKLEDQNQFSQMESSFFLSIVYYVLFDDKTLLKLYKGCVTDEDPRLKNLNIFPLIRRLDNLNKIKEFNRNLKDTNIDNKNVVKCIPRREIQGILNSYPACKDWIHLERLSRYIKIALDIKVTDIKSVLVIERVLQVIGEYITPEENNDYTFRRFIALILPRDVVHILRRTRHELSHLKSYVFKPKAECEKNISLFRSIQKEIRSISDYLKLVFCIQKLSAIMHLVKFLNTEVEKAQNFIHLYKIHVLPSSIPVSQEEYISFKTLFFYKYRYAYQIVSEIVLSSLENYIENEIIWTENWEHMKNLVLYTLWPLKWLIQLLQDFGDERTTNVIDTFETIKIHNEISPISDLKDKTNIFISKCKYLFSTNFYMNHGFTTHINQYQKKKKIKPIKSIAHIEHFFKVLKGFIYLSNQEKEEIRREIPEIVKKSLYNKETLVKSIKEGFSLNIDRESSEFHVSYLSKKKIGKFYELYQRKDVKALDILQTLDPIAELEDVFSKNSVDKKKYEALCNIMQFSDHTKKILGRLVAGQRKKVLGNNLINLLNRIHLLKEILIEENEEVFNLWLKVKSKTSRQYITDKTVWYYLRYPCLQTSIEMLLFDCMIVFKNEKQVENPFIKSSKLYCGIDLRNVISHGSPILENLCGLLDPEDLPSDLIQKALRLINDEDSIEAILELYKCLNDDYSLFLQVINSDEKDDYIDLKRRIFKCEDWKNYALLLPYHQTSTVDKT